jgi:hypothetical protein
MSPTQPTGRCKKPHCVAGSSGETLNGEAGGAKFCKVTGTTTESNRDLPLESAMSRGKDKSVGMGASLNQCAKSPR